MRTVTVIFHGVAEKYQDKFISELLFHVSLVMDVIHILSTTGHNRTLSKN